MSTHDRLIWQGFPAWSKFAWLYLASFVAGSRGLRILWQGTTRWAGWLAGAVALLVCAACLRQWAQYLIFSNRVVMRNGYTGRDIQTVTHEVIAEINLSQVRQSRGSSTSAPLWSTVRVANSVASKGCFAEMRFGELGILRKTYRLSAHLSDLSLLSHEKLN